MSPFKGPLHDATRSFRQTLSAGSLRRRFATGALWSLAAAVTSQSFNLLTSVLCARLLGQKGFGELGIIQSTLGMFGVWAGMGLGLTTIKYVAEFHSTDPQRTARIIGCVQVVALFTGGLAALVLLLFAPALSSGVLNSPKLAPDLRIASFLILFNALSGTQMGALAGFEAFKTLARVNLLNGLITFPLTLAGVLIGGLQGAVWGILIAAGGSWLVSYLALTRACRSAGVSGVHLDVLHAWRERAILWTFSLPAFLGDIVLVPVSWILSAMLVNQPHGYESMGIFSAANQLRSLLLFIPSVVGQVLIPMTSSLSANPDRRKIKSAVSAAILINAAIALPILLVLFFFSSFVMSMYGSSFSSHGTVLKLTAATGALTAIQVPVGNLIAGLGRMWAGALQNLGWAVTLTLSAWYLIRAGWGAEGLALAYLIAYCAHATWTFWFGLRLLNQGSAVS